MLVLAVSAFCLTSILSDIPGHRNKTRIHQVMKWKEPEMGKEIKIRRSRHMTGTGIGGRVILPLAVAALIMGILLSLYSMMWSERMKEYTLQECEMAADALLKQIELEQGNLSDMSDNRIKLASQLNVLAGWAYAYGGTSDEELSSLYFISRTPDAIAFLKGEEYQAFLGDFPREEFDKVVNSDGEPAYAVYSDELAEGDFSDPTMLIKGEKNNTYLLTDLILSEVTVVSRYSDDLGIAREIWLLQSEFSMDRILTGSDIVAVITSKTDHTVEKIYGDISLSPGDVLKEKPDPSGILERDGIKYIAGMEENEACRVYTLVPESRLSSRSVISPFFPAFLFTLLFLFTMLYAWFLRTDILRGRVEADGNQGGVKKLSKILMRRVRLMFVLFSTGICVLFVLVSVLCIVDRSRVWGNKILAEMDSYLSESDRNARMASISNTSYEETTAVSIQFLMDADSDRRQQQALEELDTMLDRSVFLVDAKGKVTAASRTRYNFADLRDPDSDLAPLMGVLEGYANRVTAGTWRSDLLEDSYYEFYVALRDSKTKGMLLVGKQIRNPVSEEDYYVDYRMPEGMTFFSVDMETGRILSSSATAYSGETASSIGLTDSVLEDGYVGENMLDGKRYLVQTRREGDSSRADVIASDILWSLNHYLTAILGTIAVGVALVILCLAAVFRLQKKTWTRLEIVKKNRQEHSEDHSEEQNASFYQEQDGELRSSRGAVGRWLRLETPFHVMSADEKFHFVLHLSLLAVLICGYLFYQNINKTGIKENTLTYLLQRTWRFGINIYAVCYALLVIAVFFVISLLLRRLILVIGRYFGNRGETIARLLGSFISYGAVIGSLLYALMFIGVNTMTILASAGIVGLGISIGAKDLIADILAGISIVFEGEFRTGDIVDIGGFRGVVEEIGVRTTKVMSMQNVKVFRNSEVSGVINLTQRHSIAQVRLEVSRKQPIEHMVEVFERELPGIRKKIPKAVEEIAFKGIDQLKYSKAVLLFETRCKEEDRWQVESELKWELDVLMEREELGYPGKMDL